MSSTLRLITWNIRHGGGRHVESQAAWLGEHEPDIVALQEARLTTLARHEAGLRAAGLMHIAHSFGLLEQSKIARDRQKNGVLIASRWPLRNLSWTGTALPLPERHLAVRVEHPAGEIELHSVYMPVGSADGDAKVITFEAIHSLLAVSSTIPRILCGDFNSPQTELPDGTLVTFGQNPRRKGGWRVSLPRKDAAERSVLVGLAASDLHDVFRGLHGYGKAEASWHYSSRYCSKAFRLDHILASSSLCAERCEYHHEPREKKLSDHSAMEALFCLPGALASP